MSYGSAIPELPDDEEEDQGVVLLIEAVTRDPEGAYEKLKRLVEASPFYRPEVGMDFLDERKYSLTEIACILGVSPKLIGEA